jgi:hypothetical protein
MLSDKAFDWLRDLTKKSSRSGTALSSQTAKAMGAISKN